MEGKEEKSKSLQVISSDTSLKGKRKPSLKSVSKHRLDLNHFNSPSKNTLDIYELMKSDVFQKQYSGVKSLRKLLVQKTDEKQHNTDVSLIDEIIAAELLPLIVKFLQQSQHVLQEEAAWIVTNMATGDSRQTRYLVEAGCVQALLSILSNGVESARERAAWAVGNIASDGPDFRDFVLDNGGASAVVKCLAATGENLPLLQTTTWLLSILCKEVKEDHFWLLAKTFPYLRELVLHWDTDLVSQTCWCLASLSCGSNTRIQELMESGISPSLIHLFGRGNQIIVPVLQIVGNVVCGDEQWTQMIIDLGVINHVSDLLHSSDPSIRRTVCWILSNVCAGNPKQVDEVLSLDTIPTLLGLLTTEGVKTQKEIVWMLRNITRSGTLDQIMFLVHNGVIHKLCEALASEEEEITKVSLDSLEGILQLGDSKSRSEGIPNPIAVEIERCKGLENLEGLLSHEVAYIYRKAFEILEKYFNG